MSLVAELKENKRWEHERTRQAGFGLVDIINNIDNKKMVGIEIGVCAGVNSHMLLEACKNISTLYAVDSWAEFTDWNGVISQSMQDQAYADARTNLKEFKNRIKIIKSTSVDAAENFEDESMDFVFVDGSHAYEDVLNDLTNYYPKVKRGGIISGHDFSFPEVAGAIQEFRRRLDLNPNIISLCNNAWYWIKE